MIAIATAMGVLLCLFAAELAAVMPHRTGGLPSYTTEAFEPVHRGTATHLGGVSAWAYWLGWFPVAPINMILASAYITQLFGIPAGRAFQPFGAIGSPVTLSVLVLAYTGASVATTFVVTAGMFGALALYGSTTKRSLAGAGQFFFMGLIGLVLASIVGIFWHSAALQFLISVVGVIIFTGLTAWDAQRLKEMALALPEGQVGSYAIVGALSLYLDFINLFLFLLRFLGDRRD